MKLALSKDMKRIDAHAIDTLNIPSTLLMTNAARHVADAALEFTGDAAVFCGGGNNGGDGVAAAVYLKKRGRFARVFFVGDESRKSPDFLEMQNRFEELGGAIEKFDPDDGDAAGYLSGCGVIIDAIFGTGLRSDIEGLARCAVDLINSLDIPVISADIASGVSADTGEIMGSAVSADITVTFSLAKPGHFTEPGCLQCGELRVRDIGIPEFLLDELESGYFGVTGEDISLPRRRRDTHKGDYGRIAIIGGCRGYTGAPVMAAKAALRAGSGLVFLGVPEDIYDIAAVKCLEAMPFPLRRGENGLFIGADVKEFFDLSRSACCLLGPGLGRSQGSFNLVYDIISSYGNPLIIDADGINAVAENINILNGAAPALILTPHEAEFTRLGGDVSGGRLAGAKSFAALHNCVLVLKGHRTISAFPDGTAYINSSGNPGMAKGGSGDVLAGMIASLIGQNFPVKDAVVAAVYLHGAAGDLCAEKLGEYSMLPGDIIEALPQIMKNKE